MAISRIKKMSLVFHRNEKGKIFKKLTQLGTVEIYKTEEFNETSRKDRLKHKQECERKLQKLDFSFNFLVQLSRDVFNEKKAEIKTLEGENKKQQKKELKPTKVSLKKENRIFSYDELESHLEKEYDIFAEIEQLEEINSSLIEIKNSISRLDAVKESLLKYNKIDVPLSELNDTKNTKIYTGLYPIENTKFLSFDDNDDVFVVSEPLLKEVLLIAIAHNNVAENVKKQLDKVGFQPIPYNFDKLVIDEIKETENKIASLVEEKKALYDKALRAVDNLVYYKCIYDFYNLEVAKQESLELAAHTAKTIIVQAWVPSASLEITTKELTSISENLIIITEEPEKGEIVPSLVISDAFSDPFSRNITAMYGAPSYDGVDPNPFVGLFYVVFFGFMFGDVGYGLILTLACAAYLLIKKPVKHSGSFIKMFFFCGISSVIWGVIFGAYFGLEESAMLATSFGRALLKLKLLDALGAGSIVVFLAALVLGILHIATGFSLNAVQKIKNKNVLDGVFNDLSWVVIFLGMGVFAISMVPGMKKANLAGLIVILIGVVMLLVGGALGKKNVLSMVTGGFQNLYGSVNVLSDVLSYSRLFGLSLTTGVIALVFNKIGIIIKDMVGGGVIGYMFAIAIWLVGHTFNFGINILGVYVHNTRLQYVEFFGKFFSGEGHAFNPLGGRTRFVHLEAQLIDTRKALKNDKVLKLSK